MSRTGRLKASHVWRVVIWSFTIAKSYSEMRVALGQSTFKTGGDDGEVEEELAAGDGGRTGKCNPEV